jgi:pyruvate kinase
MGDGEIELRVRATTGTDAECEVVVGGELRSNKGVNAPGVRLRETVPTEKDLVNAAFGIEHGVDYFALSFVRSVEEVRRLRALLRGKGSDIPIITKIEKSEALDGLTAILEASDGVMIARGDLGLEVPIHQVPLIQKDVIRAARAAARPVITATQMLESMIQNPRPTRAEAADIANAVFDGTDAVMLSGETAIGDHPVRVVETMDSIVREVERSEEYAELREQRVPGASELRTEGLARAARYLARDLGASAIVASTESGYTARKMAKYRPGVPVVASTPTERVRRQLALSWGVHAEHTPFTERGANDVIENAVQAALDAGVAESGDTVVVLSGMMTEIEGAGTTNMLKVHVAAETLETGTGVVSGRASGPIVHAADGDLSGIDDGTIVALPGGFDDEFTGNLARIGAIVDTRSGMTGYPAMIARELGIPMVSNADLSAVPEGTVATVDAERGVIYEGELADPRARRETDVPGTDFSARDPSKRA